MSVRNVLGCALSHMTIWERIALSEGDPNEVFLILEDDVQFAADLPQQWSEVRGERDHDDDDDDDDDDEQSW